MMKYIVVWTRNRISWLVGDSRRKWWAKGAVAFLFVLAFGFMDENIAAVFVLGGFTYGEMHTLLYAWLCADLNRPMVRRGAMQWIAPVWGIALALIVHSLLL